MGVHRSPFPFLSGVSGAYYWLSTYFTILNRTNWQTVRLLDDMVSHLGINPQSFRRAYVVRGSWVLWRMVE